MALEKNQEKKVENLSQNLDHIPDKDLFLVGGCVASYGGGAEMEEDLVSCLWSSFKPSSFKEVPGIRS